MNTEAIGRPRPVGKLYLLIGMLTAGFALVVLMLARAGVPLLAGDRAFFVPVAYFIKIGMPWISPIATGLDPGSSNGAPIRYVFHGWLYPWLIAALAPAPTWPGIFAGKAFVALLSFGLLMSVGGRSLRRMASVTSLALVAAGVLFYVDGRPETLSTPILFVLAVRALEKRSSILFDAAGLALLFTAQPANCAVAAVGYGVLQLMRAPVAIGAARVAATGGLAMAMAGALFILVYPFPLADWLAGVANQMALLAGRSEWSTFPTYFLLNPQLPLLLVPAIGAGASLVATSLAATSLTARLASITATSLFLFVLGFGALKVPATIYNLLPWLPVATWYWLGRIEEGAAGIQNWLAGASVAAACLGAGAGLTKTLIQNAASAAESRASINAGQKAVQPVLDACHSIVVSPSLVPLLETQAASPRIRYEGRARESDRGPVEAYITAQYGSQTSRPPARPGFTAVYASYVSPARFAGLSPYRTPSSHNIAILLRNGSACLSRYRGASGLP